MTLSAFDDKSQEPKKEDLFRVLAQASELWEEITSTIRAEYEAVREDWGFSGTKWGWALRLKSKKRAILYLTPSTGFFYVGFALGQKAVDAAHDSNLPSSILDTIDASQKFAEGRAVRIEVRTRDDVEDVVHLARIKMAN